MNFSYKREVFKTRAMMTNEIKVNLIVMIFANELETGELIVHPDGYPLDPEDVNGQSL
jgi:hypothetical protein